MNLSQWNRIYKAQAVRFQAWDPTNGCAYSHLARTEQPYPWTSPVKDFDAIVAQLCYYVKALLVRNPDFSARESLLAVINPIVAWNAKVTEVPQADENLFLTAVVHLILASLEPETLRANGYKDSRMDHLQDVDAALVEIRDR